MTQSHSKVQSIVGVSEGRPDDDFYRTPSSAVEALLKVEEFHGNYIWEPACGDGSISEVLRNHGYRVYSTDLIERGYGITGINFLNTLEKPAHVITNPPYKLAQQFVEHGLKVSSGKVAMLLKLAFLEGGKRKGMFLRTPLKKVYVFSNRITMGRNGDEYKSGMMAFAWFVWDHEYKGEPTIGWL